MSKFGVVVMGPAGAGKVCALTALRQHKVLTTNPDHLLLRFDTTPPSQ